MPPRNPRSSPFTQAVQSHLDSLGILQRHLVPVLGRQSRVSKILCGVLQPSLQDLARLHFALGIPYSLMIPAPTKAWRRKIIKFLKAAHAWP